VERVLLHSVNGRGYVQALGLAILDNVTPFFRTCPTYLAKGTTIGGQFGWGGTPLK